MVVVARVAAVGLGWRVVVCVAVGVCLVVVSVAVVMLAVAAGGVVAPLARIAVAGVAA